MSQNLVRNLSQSCGCLKKEAAARIKASHGGAKTRLYNIWCAMKRRCKNQGNHNYGGRGITVCDEWRDNFESFRDWALSNGYRDDLSIDRVDNDGNYEAINCRWATHTEQTNNSRKNVLITAHGETHTMAEWSRRTRLSQTMIQRRHTTEGKVSEETLAPTSPRLLKANCKAMTLTEWSRSTGIDPRTLHKRIFKLGWTVERAVTTTPRSYRKPCPALLVFIHRHC